MVFALLYVLQSNFQFTQTLPLAQLTKHYCKQLMTTSEMSHIAIFIILINKIANLLLSRNSINWVKTYLSMFIVQYY